MRDRAVFSGHRAAAQELGSQMLRATWGTSKMSELGSSLQK